MKKKYILTLKILEFLLLLSLIVIVPIIILWMSDDVALKELGSIDIKTQLINATLSLSISIWLLFSWKSDYNFTIRLKKMTLSKKLKAMLACFLKMIGIALFFSVIEEFFKTESLPLIGSGPQGLLQWILFTITTAILASFEEIYFRLYMPKRIHYFIRMFRITVPKKVCFFLIEIMPLLFFCMGHLYLGIFGALNSFLLGALLRRLCKKTQSIIPSCIIHSVYNMILFTLAFVVY